MKKLSQKQKIIISLVAVGFIGTASWLLINVIKNKGKTPEQIAEEKRLKDLAKSEAKRLKELAKGNTVVPPVQNTPTTTNTTTNESTGGSLPNGATSCERTVNNHDSSWNYVKCSGIWYTQSKGSSGWTSLQGNTVAINKLEAYSGS